MFRAVEDSKPKRITIAKGGESRCLPRPSEGQSAPVPGLLAARSRQLRFYGENGTTIARQPDGSSLVTDGTASFMLKNYDFNVRSFRSNLVLCWEWRPGSMLYVVWQQNRSGSTTARDTAGLRSMFGSLSAPGDNFFAVKTTFRISTR